MTQYLRIIRIILLHLLLGAGFLFFHSQLTISEFSEFRLRVENIRGEDQFELPAKETYLLKIWGDDVIEKIAINSVAIPHAIFRSRIKLKEFYYVLPRGVVNAGQNTIKIFPHRRCSLRIKNCISATNFGVILPKNSTTKPSDLSHRAIAKTLLIFCVLGTAYLLGLLNYFHLPFNKLFAKYVLSYVPCLLILLAIREFSLFLPFEIYFLKNSFTGLSFLLVAIFQIPAVLSLIIKDGVLSLKTSTVSTIHFLKTSEQKILVSGKKIAQNAADHWIVQWWLSRRFDDKCAITFFISLLTSTFLLSFGFEFLAEIIANIAYLALTTAVVIKLKKSRDAAEDV